MFVGKRSLFFATLLVTMAVSLSAAENQPAKATDKTEATSTDGATDVDALEAAPVEGEKKKKAFDFGAVIAGHLMDGAPIIKLDWNIGGTKKVVADKTALPKGAIYYKNVNGYHYYEGGINMSITRRIFVMMFLSVFLILLFTWMARKIAADPFRRQGRFVNMLEALVQFVRKEIAAPNMSGHDSGYHPYLLSLFFFILISNLYGLFPNFGETIELAASFFGGAETVNFSESDYVKYMPLITPTGDLGVTSMLAFLTFIMIWHAGFKYQGPKFILHIVPKGVPLPLWLIMWPIEALIGPVARCFSLMVRLFANMTAGHILILALICLIFQFESGYVGIGSVLGGTAIYMLEIFVAFLQAFIFTLLTAMFIGSSMHRH